MSMKYHWIDEIAEFKKISSEWDAAVERSSSHNPFLLSDFIVAWFDHFGRRYPMRILVIRNGAAIAGGMPLCLKKGSWPYSFVRVLSYAGGTAANYTEPLYSDKGLNFFPVLEEALLQRKDWDLLYLSDIRQGSRAAAEISSLPAGGPFSVKFYSDHYNWAIDLSEGTEKYLSGLSSKMRRDLRAKRKRLEGKFGPLRLQQVNSRAEVEKLFELYRRYSLSAFAKRGGESSFEDRGYSGFFRDFLGAMEEKGRLEAHMLYAGDEPLAISFGYRFGPGFNWTLTAFNYEHKYYRPGYLLIEEIVKMVASRGETVYNWYGYERFYKSQWCNRRTPIYRFFLVKRSIRGNIYRVISSAENALRSSRVVVSVARKLRHS